MAKKEKANGMAILNEQINKKEFSRVYLLGGTEPYLIYQRTSLNLQIPCHFLQNAEWCWLRTAISSRTAVKSWKKP